MNNGNVFWVVGTEHPPFKTTVVHNSRLTAIDQAILLAKESPGKKFYVLEAQEYYCLPNPKPVQTILVPF